MSETRHTPGPWFVFANGHCVGGSLDGNPNQKSAGVAMCSLHLRSDEENRANAAFIVRACNSHDDLLTASKQMLRELCDDGITSETAHALKAAIAKAEGRS